MALISVEITAKDEKDSMATACATLCYPDAASSRNIDETLRSLVWKCLTTKSTKNTK